MTPPPPADAPGFDQCDTNAGVDPVEMQIRRYQGALLLKLAGILVPIIIAGSVTVYIQTDRNHQELLRQSAAMAEHGGSSGHDGTRDQLVELIAELRAMSQAVAGARAVQDQRWAEINRRLDRLERRRDGRTRATATR